MCAPLFISINPFMYSVTCVIHSDLSIEFTILRTCQNNGTLIVACAKISAIFVGNYSAIWWISHTNIKHM